MSDTVIKVEGVSKKYCRSLKHTMLYGVTDLSRSFLGFDQQTERLRDGEFWSLKDVSFEVKQGEALGLIGANGSGKSTLLKMLNGIMMPDKGRIEISGRVGALIEVGAGFHPMLTGRENIYINGAIIGMTKKEIDRKFDEIVDFAGIDNFIDSPVKHYSSGMYVRLGFAIAAHAELDILLVDEVLAVGDVAFQIKSMDRIMDMRAKGVTVMFVTHDANAVKRLCNVVCWLHEGRLVKYGDPVEVPDDYLYFMTSRGLSTGNRRTDLAAGDLPELLSLEMFDFNGRVTDNFRCGEPAKVKVRYRVLKETADKIIIGIAIFRNDDLYVCGLSTGLDGFVVEKDVGEHELILEYPSLNLLGGSYHIKAGIFHSSAMVAYHFSGYAFGFRVTAPYCAEGVVFLEHKWITN